jgi:hypothetical protein
MFSELRYGYGLWFKEPVTAVKIGSLVLIILGIVGLNLSRIHREEWRRYGQFLRWAAGS